MFGMSVIGQEKPLCDMSVDEMFGTSVACQERPLRFFYTYLELKMLTSIRTVHCVAKNEMFFFIGKTA